MAEEEDIVDADMLAAAIEAEEGNANETTTATAAGADGEKDQGEGDDDEGKRTTSKKGKKEKKRGKESKKDSGRDKKKRRKSKFIDDAAGDDDDDDEDDDEREMNPQEAAEADADLERIMNHKSKRHLLHEDENEMTEEQLAADIEARYGKKGGGGGGAAAAAAVGRPAGGGGAVIPRHIPASQQRFSANFLPRSTDPKVFSVKVRPNMARILVPRIVNKCYCYSVGINFEKKPVDLGIISVFCLDHVKEHIYVEAHRQLFVENALNGLEGIFRGHIALVDPGELMQLMEHRVPKKAELEVGAFVRLRKNPYRDDLAVVVEVLDNGRSATVKMIPREDFVGKPPSRSNVRHPQRFFAPHLAVGAQQSAETGRCRWGDLTFDADGYLWKQFSARMLMCGIGMQKPTIDELATFFKNDPDEVRMHAQHSSLAEQSAVPLRIGEVVRVVKGQLQGIVGQIVDIVVSTNVVKLSCKVPRRPEPLEIRTELSSVAKHFTEGAHLVVERGKFNGESGTVIKTKNDVVVVVSDRTGVEFEVCTNECRQSKLTGSGGHSLGSWRLFDLVQLTDGQTVACIVKCNVSDLVVLTENNTAQRVEPAMIKASIRTQYRQTLDQLRNVVKRGCEVVIRNGPRIRPEYVGKTAKVEQVSNKTLFLRCAGMFENSGVVAIDAGSVVLVGGKTSLKQVEPPRQLPLPDRKAHPAVHAPGAQTQLESAHSEWDQKSEYYVNDNE